MDPTDPGMMVSAGDAPETGLAAAPSPVARRRWMVGLLTVAFGLNLLDRQIINILAEPIKHDLALSDAQLGALTGLSFALLYSIVALPIARAADRGDRVRVIGLAVLAWSVFTAACGAAGSFTQLLLLRIGVGVGEAGCAPPSQSLIADEHAPGQRAGALAIFALGSPVGAAVGLVAGGLLAGMLGWRLTMLCAGLPGLLVGLLVLGTLRDHRRTGFRPSLPPLGPTLMRLARSPSFLLTALGCALLSFVNYGAMAFAGSFYLRVHAAGLTTLAQQLNLTPIGVVGLGLGLLGGVGGILGALTGGALGNRYGGRNPKMLVLIPAWGSLGCALGYVAMFTASGASVSLSLFFVAAFFSTLWSGPGTLAMQRLADVRARATALAVSLFINSAVGLGLGPLLIGTLSDVLAPRIGPAEGLRAALLSGLSVGVLSALAYGFASRTIIQDIARAGSAQEEAAA